MFAFFVSLCLGAAKLSAEGMPQAATYADHPQLKIFMDYMVREHQLSKQTLVTLFATMIVEPQRAKQFSDYTNRAPEQRREWQRYRQQFLTRERITAGVAFWQKHRRILSKTRKHYGVPIEVMVATLGMESFYGQRNGNFSILEALTVFVAEDGRRQSFYFRELEHFLLFCLENDYNPALLKGSYSGAMGPAQFIPTTAVHYARDGDDDGQINLFTNFADIVGSVGYYYAACKWQRGKPIVKRLKVSPQSPNKRSKRNYLRVQLAAKVEHWRLYPNYQALKCYNNSHLYALTLWKLAQLLKQRYEAEIR